VTELSGRSGGRQGSRASRPAARRTGRRAGDSGTREAILSSARNLFAERGYDRATIRGIAAQAGVDPALVHHFYGTKERLFAAAMELPIVPSELISATLEGASRRPGETTGEHIVRTAVTVWDSPGVRTGLLGLLRSALTSENAAAMVREFVTSAILGPMVSRAGGDPEDTAFRAALIGSQMVGLAMARYLLQLQPVASALPGDLAAAVGPSIERYLTGRLDHDPEGSGTV
jgi:AcrR family transcriptional regulator